MVSVNCRTVIFFFILAFPLSFLTVNNSVIGSGCIMLLLIVIKVKSPALIDIKWWVTLYGCMSLYVYFLSLLLPQHPFLSQMKGGQKWLGLNIINQFGYHCREAEVNKPRLFSLFCAFSLFNSHNSIIYTFPVCRHGHGHVCSGVVSSLEASLTLVVMKCEWLLEEIRFLSISVRWPHTSRSCSNPVGPQPAQTTVIALSPFSHTKPCLNIHFITCNSGHAFLNESSLKLKNTKITCLEIEFFISWTDLKINIVNHE